MSDRIHSITIILAEDLHEDDAEVLVAACRQFRGVLSVKSNVSEYADEVAAERVAKRARAAIAAALAEFDRLGKKGA